jgi:hypothetical protein
MGVIEEASVSESDTSPVRMTRTIPPSLGLILTELELDAPQVVTVAELAALATRTGIGTEPRVVADRLRKLGWPMQGRSATATSSSSCGPRSRPARRSTRRYVSCRHCWPKA